MRRCVGTLIVVAACVFPVAAQDPVGKPVRFPQTSWHFIADGEQQFKGVTLELYDNALRLVPNVRDRRRPEELEIPTIRFADIASVDYGEGMKDSYNIVFGYTDTGSHWVTVKEKDGDYYVLKFAETSRFKVWAAEFERRSKLKIQAAGK